MPDEPQLVAFDTGIFVAALLRQLPVGRSLSSQVVQLALEGAMRVVLIPAVTKEFLQIGHREGQRCRAEDLWREFVVNCRVTPIRVPALPQVLVDAEVSKYTPKLRHKNDAPIAVALAHCEADYFIHSNPDHWSSDLDLLLGTRVVTCEQYLRAMGVKPCPPDPKVRRRGVR